MIAIMFLHGYARDGQQGGGLLLGYPTLTLRQGNSRRELPGNGSGSLALRQYTVSSDKELKPLDLGQSPKP